MRRLLKVLPFIFSLINLVICEGSNDNETEAVAFLRRYDTAAGINLNQLSIKMWNFDTNMTDETEEEMLKQKTISAQFDRDMRAEALQFISFGMSEDVQRQLNKIKDIGTSAQPNVTKVRELSSVLTKMQTNYEGVRLCFDAMNCSVDPDYLTEYRDFKTLQTLWSTWRLQAKVNKKLFTRYVEMSNEAIQFLGFSDTGEEWRSAYESDTFVKDANNLMNEIKPLYEQLHAFVRRRLKQVYGENWFPSSGHIPANILGDLFAADWTNIFDIVKPYPSKISLDVTEEMIKQNYTVEKMFHLSEDFFVSLGFEKMVPSFWTKSIFKDPNDGRQLMCSTSAWDFFDQKDFRIGMCATISQEDLMALHHEMGHIQYYMQYREQPVVYRDGANPGFHEAVGDVIALSVQTPEHLKKIGLIDYVPTDTETDLNFLMNMALLKVAILPFAFIVDQWRWAVFSGKTKPGTYNEDWWSFRCNFQGVFPPTNRSEADFDPGSIFHVIADVPYIRYFLSFIIQFQFHKAACDAAGHTGPLHRCDIYNSKEAGDKIRLMLKLGSSKPWPVAMKELTGQDKMGASAMLEYFQPLLDYLRKENGNDYGWDPDCPHSTDENQQELDQEN